MTEFHMIFNNIISSPVTLFIASCLFTAASFLWAGKLLKKFRHSLRAVMAAGIFNGSIAVIAEIAIDKPLPSAMMLLVPLVTVLELWFVSHDSLWSYFFLLSAFLLNFGALHDLSVAAMGLWPYKDIGTPASIGYRMGIFSLALLAASVVLVILAKCMPVVELSILMHSKKKGTLLLIYMAIASIVLMITAAVTVPVLFNDVIPETYRIPVYLDLILKDLMILAFSYIIVLLQCREERAAQKSTVLQGELHQEKKYRSVIQEELSAARLDGITGLKSRAALENSIEQYFKENEVSGTMFIIDLDNFKMVNDSLGHRKGDQVLKELSLLIQSEFRKEDIIGRVGGDEFCVFAQNLKTEESVVRKAKDLLSKSVWTHTTEHGDSFQTTISIGIAYCPEYGDNYDTLFEHADIALYQAKDQGKDGFCIYSGEKRKVYKGLRKDM